MSIAKDVSSLMALKAEADAMLSVILTTRDRIYSRKAKGEQGLEADFQFALSMSWGMKETMERIEGFARAHIYSENGIILTKGSHAHEKLKDLLDKIPRRLLKARERAKRLDRHMKNLDGPAY